AFRPGDEREARGRGADIPVQVASRARESQREWRGRPILRANSCDRCELVARKGTGRSIGTRFDHDSRIDLPREEGLEGENESRSVRVAKLLPDLREAAEVPAR